ncbi:Tn3 family transposase, partial [Escherichia coli]|uniref:Tn3 family transposase n=1 Tax=Escherichia coli TaxID=562 RepID=UPI00301CF6BF
HYTDTAGFTDHVFALMHLLGFRFAPRIRDLGETKLYGHCCKVSDEAAFCLIQRPYISKTLLTRRISPRGSP